MKKFKFGVSIGFKPEEVNIILGSEQMAKLKEKETNRKNEKRINRSRINNAKFKIQQQGFHQRKNRLKTKTLQITRGFDLAKSWCPPKKENEE